MDFSKTPIAELAAIIADHLKQHGVEVVLVGGLAVEIYTENLYLTKDIDMLNINYQKPQTLKSAMASLGFSKQGRVYAHDTTDITLMQDVDPIDIS